MEISFSDYAMSLAGGLKPGFAILIDGSDLSLGVAVLLRNFFRERLFSLLTATSIALSSPFQIKHGPRPERTILHRRHPHSVPLLEWT